jgi:hypothetical protein
MIPILGKTTGSTFTSRSYGSHPSFCFDPGHLLQLLLSTPHVSRIIGIEPRGFTFAYLLAQLQPLRHLTPASAHVVNFTNTHACFVEFVTLRLPYTILFPPYLTLLTIFLPQRQHLAFTIHLGCLTILGSPPQDLPPPLIA